MSTAASLKWQKDELQTFTTGVLISDLMKVTTQAVIEW